MSKAAGVILILAGMGVASSLLAIGPDAGGDPPKAAAAHDPPVIPAVPQKMTQPAAAPARAQQVSAAKPPPAKFSAAVVVTLPHRTEPLPATGHKLGSLPRDKAALARELQLELKRVGCYAGEPNGAWTPAARKSMKAFTERVNASLPVGEPDEILLALVQAHRGEACGAPCPPGQGLAGDGRCLPGAILAQATRKGSAPAVAAATRPRGAPPAEKPAPAIAALSTTAAVLPAPPVPPSGAPPILGRMALAGPTGDAAPPAVGEPQPAPGQPAVQNAKPRNVAARRTRAQERARFEPRGYGRRSGFVESVLFSRHSLF
jgi:hypothetical protein